MSSSGSVRRLPALLAGIAWLCASSAAAQIASKAGGRGNVLFEVDWHSQATVPEDVDGEGLAASVRLLGGSGAVVTRDGARFLRIGAPAQRFRWTTLELRLPGTLPDEFTIEFDMLVPLSTAYPVEIRVPVGGERAGYRGANVREQFVTAQCGAVRTGVYGGYATTKTIRLPDALATAWQRCRASIAGRSLEVGFADAAPVVVNDVNFGRADRIQVMIPGAQGEEAYVGPIRVFSAASAAPAVQRAGAAVETPVPAQASAPTATPNAPAVSVASTAPAGVASGSATPPVATDPNPHITEAQQLLASGVSAAAAAAQLAAKYTLDEKAIVKTLVSVGFDPKEVAAFLKQQGHELPSAVIHFVSTNLSQTPEGQARVAEALWWYYSEHEKMFVVLLRDGGMALRAIAAGLDKAGVPLAHIAQFLFQTQPPQTAAGVLHEVLNLAPPQLVEHMHAAGIDPEQILMALADIYGMDIGTAIETVGTRVAADKLLAAAAKMSGINAMLAAQALARGGHSTDQVAVAVAEWVMAGNAVASHAQARAVALAILAIDQTQEGVNAFFRVIMEVMKLPPAIIVSIAQEAEVRTPAIVVALRDVSQLSAGLIMQLARQLGLKTGDVMTELIALYKAPTVNTMNFVARTLREGGYTAEQTAAILKNEYTQTAQANAALLADAGFPMPGIRDALVAVYSMSVGSVTQLLTSLGIN